MDKIKKRRLRTGHIRLILIGIGLGMLFWLFESVAHVVVFRDTGFLQQILSPELHEVWMRLTVVGMFLGFGFYAQMIVTARRRAEEAARMASAELNQIFETSADGMRVIDKDFNVLRANIIILADLHYRIYTSMGTPAGRMQLEISIHYFKIPSQPPNDSTWFTYIGEGLKKSLFSLKY